MKKPVPEYYYSEREWDRLGCGPLPAERDQSLQPKDIDPWAKLKDRRKEKLDRRSGSVE